MYKNKRRKSGTPGRVLPYDVTSSNSSNRKSTQFISPVINYDLSLSAIKKGLVPLAKLDQKNSNLNESVQESNKLVLKNEKPNENDQIESNDEQLIERFKDTNSQVTVVNKPNPINIQVNEDKLDLINQPANNLEPNNEQSKDEDILINKCIDDKIEQEIDLDSKKQTTSQKTEFEDQFDSEFDKLFGNSSFADKLNNEFKTIEKEINIENNDNESFKSSEDDEELFDSDAIINEYSENDELNDEDSNLMKIEEIKEIDEDDGFDLMDSEDDFGSLEIDSTLIFRNDDPVQSQLIVEQIDSKEEIGFKTASGEKIQISMSEEEQKQKAKLLGIYL